MLKSADCTCIRSFRQGISNGGGGGDGDGGADDFRLPAPFGVRVFDIGEAAARLSSAPRRVPSDCRSLRRPALKNEEDEVVEEDAGGAAAPFCCCSSQRKSQEKKTIAEVAY